MRRISLTAAIFSILLLCGSRAPAGLRRAEAASAAPAGNPRVAVAGYIGDSMCGLHHGKSVNTGAEERDCTLQCVSDGSTFILADRANRKVYQLDDQETPRRFAGRKVRVTGEIDGKGLRVETIEPAE